MKYNIMNKLPLTKKEIINFFNKQKQLISLKEWASSGRARASSPKLF